MLNGASLYALKIEEKTVKQLNKSKKMGDKCELEQIERFEATAWGGKKGEVGEEARPPQVR